jgi:hypothetical protein
MRPLIAIFIFYFLTVQKSFGQDILLSKKISLLSKVANIPFDRCKEQYDDCGDNLIWEIIKYKEAAIKPLIEKIGDTSYSKAYYKEDGKIIRVRTGVIAYIALDKIFSVPIAKLTGMQFDVFICGWYPYGFINYLNSALIRTQLQEKLRKYYSGTPLKWVTDKKSILNHCASLHGINGHYEEK